MNVQALSDEQLVQAVVDGEKEAIEYLLDRYEEGDEQDMLHALTLLKQAAEQGDVGTCLFLGNVYSADSRVEIDKAEAEKWYNKAIEQGSEEARLAVAIAYLAEESLRDRGLAVLEKCIAHEHAPALYVKATALIAGKYDFAVDVEAGRKLLVKAEECAQAQENLDALAMLAQVYLEGLYTVPVDQDHGLALLEAPLAHEVPKALMLQARMLLGDMPGFAPSEEENAMQDAQDMLIQAAEGGETMAVALLGFVEAVEGEDVDMAYECLYDAIEDAMMAEDENCLAYMAERFMMYKDNEDINQIAAAIAAELEDDIDDDVEDEAEADFDEDEDDVLAEDSESLAVYLFDVAAVFGSDKAKAYLAHLEKEECHCSCCEHH